MARLVQGDVGCGKTAIAMGALYLAAKHGWQGALMAPTEILARQHFETAQTAHAGAAWASLAACFWAAWVQKRAP